MCILCYLPRDILSQSLKTHHVSVNDLVMSYTTLGEWCQLFTSKRTVRLKELRAMKKKSEKFSICTFCLSKVFKVLGVWAVHWLLPVQVSRFISGSRNSPKTLLHLVYVSQSIPNFTGRSYFNSTSFTIALQETLSVYFVWFKICKLSRVLAVAWL